MNNYNEFLELSAEINLEIKANNLYTEADALLASVYYCIDKYDRQTITDKITELYTLNYAFIDLANKCMLNNSYEVFDKCEVYIHEIDFAVKKLRNKYNSLIN